MKKQNIDQKIARIVCLLMLFCIFCFIIFPRAIINWFVNSNLIFYVNDLMVFLGLDNLNAVDFELRFEFIVFIIKVSFIILFGLWYFTWANRKIIYNLIINYFKKKFREFR